jgi:ABC-type molybdenum transport system ATPase subunit/photorepair protein PhrA
MPGAPLVTLDRVDVDLAGVNVLRNVTWQLMRGEHWGVVGANGSGKSTLLGLIAGTVWPAPERGIRRYDFGAGAETDAVRATSRSPSTTPAWSCTPQGPQASPRARCSPTAT